MISIRLCNLLYTTCVLMKYGCLQIAPRIPDQDEIFLTAVRISHDADEIFSVRKKGIDLLGTCALVKRSSHKGLRARSLRTRSRLVSQEVFGFNIEDRNFRTERM
jgi:hypothetical protein